MSSIVLSHALALIGTSGPAHPFAHTLTITLMSLAAMTMMVIDAED